MNANQAIGAPGLNPNLGTPISRSALLLTPGGIDYHIFIHASQSIPDHFTGMPERPE